MDTKLASLASTLSIVANEEKATLKQLKLIHGDIKREDFLWHYLLQSFSTMGRSAGWHGLIGNKDNYNRITFEELNSLNEEQRVIVVNEVCKKAKIRMHAKKAAFILECFKQIKELGGPEKAKNKLLSLEGRDKKIRFLMQFHGIGEKYSRNIMMDVYHEDFRDSIAIDTRIKEISKLLGVEFDSYEEEEQFYLAAANQAGLNGWEVDRLLYNFKDKFKKHLA